MKSLLPEPYALLARVALWGALVLAVFFYGELKGSARVHAQWDADVVSRQLQIARITEKSTQSTLNTVTVYVERKQKEDSAQSTISTQVTDYVPPSAPVPDCPGISRNFVFVWNAANRGLPLPDAASRADDADSGATDTDVAAQHAREAALCRGTEQKLEALQGWVRSQQEIANNP